MAKDDYFNVQYEILKHLYKQTKRGERVDPQKLSDTYFKINNRYWGFIITNMQDDGYIKDINVRPAIDGYAVDGLEDMSITPKGIEYLFDNNFVSNVKNTLKDLNTIMPNWV